MSGQDGEQNKSEDATPFKLKRAREKGQVARSMEVGFFGGLAACAIFASIAGPSFAAALAQMMRTAIEIGIDHAAEPEAAPALVGSLAWTALRPVLVLGATIMAVVALLEVVQLRGFFITGEPLKPDFTRLNPARGLKQLFSARMLKQTLKTLLKAAVYGAVAWLVLRSSVERYAIISTDGDRLGQVLTDGGLRLMFAFIATAFGFVLLDQILVRRDFLKTMRMSRREVTREAREREGEPRLKAKRKQIHAEFARQQRGLTQLPGSDLVVVNPEHFAVALHYDTMTMSAPSVSVKGRNLHALKIKAEAVRLGIAIVADPKLARALFRECEIGREIPAGRYAAVADLYLDLARMRASNA